MGADLKPQSSQSLHFYLKQVPGSMATTSDKNAGRYARLSLVDAQGRELEPHPVRDGC